MTRWENMKGLEMQSTMMTLVGQRGSALKTFGLKTCTGMACAVTIGLAGLATTALPASAFVGGADSSLQQQLKQNSPITEVAVRPARYTGRPGSCWYDTDPSRTQGFWDVCPQ
jgi:hypothetical protein